METNRLTIIGLFILLISLASCKKLIEIPPPVGTITTSQVFSSDAQASSAIAGLYYNAINTNLGFASYGMTAYAGMSADELIPYDQNTNDYYIQFQQNSIALNNNILITAFWSNPYSLIYTANAILEGLANSTGVDDSLKSELIGEAKFMRAFCNFYVVNLFGDIPLVTSINWHNTSLLGRTPVTQVYSAIIQDLKDAQNSLASDYSAGNGQRIVPNRWAATALLARVYLFIGDWQNANIQSGTVLNNSNLFSLTDSLDDVFLINSTEAIWQLQQDNSGGTVNNYNATLEGLQFIPINSTARPFAFLTSQLLNAFEPMDRRRSHWVDSTIYSGDGVTYYYPYKYKMGRAQATINGAYTEYDMVLRFAEQYLINAEAKAELNDLQGAALDVNAIRFRAGLGNIIPSSQADMLTAIQHERRMEFFAEWGHRWLDLKRTGQATTILSTIKPLWTANAQLYPIPIYDLTADPNIKQNPGY